MVSITVIDIGTAGSDAYVFIFLPYDFISSAGPACAGGKGAALLAGVGQVDDSAAEQSCACGLGGVARNAARNGRLCG
eukprot:7384518-Prymnesium_polylepis.1